MHFAPPCVSLPLHIADSKYFITVKRLLIFIYFIHNHYFDYNNRMEDLKKWEDLQELRIEDFNFDDFLNLDLLAAHKEFRKKMDITRRTTGSISLISSVALVYHILCSVDGLSTTYHRLLFGLCIADIMTSLSCALNDTMVPEEMKYFIPNARGNAWTCDTNGFLLYMGGMGGMLFNCSLCFYYLAIIKFNKKDDYIKKKLEPWFHGISILLPLFYSIFFLAKQGFNAPYCFLSTHPGNNPPHCIGSSDGDVLPSYKIPCGRGSDIAVQTSSKIVRFSGQFVFLIPPFVIVGTMAVMYRTVLKTEKKAKMNFAKSLRSPLVKLGVDHSDHPEGPKKSSAKSTFVTSMKKIKNRIKKRDSPTHPKLPQRWNMAATKKRAILVMATGYSLAWVFTWVPYILYYVSINRTSTILAGVFNPLQGFYNLLVYLYPKMTSKRKSRRGKLENLTWCKAFAEVWMPKSGSLTRRRALSKKSSSRLSDSRWSNQRSSNSRLSNPRLSINPTPNSSARSIISNQPLRRSLRSSYSRQSLRTLPPERKSLIAKKKILLKKELKRPLSTEHGKQNDVEAQVHQESLPDTSQKNMEFFLPQLAEDVRPPSPAPDPRRVRHSTSQKTVAFSIPDDVGV